MKNRTLSFIIFAIVVLVTSFSWSQASDFTDTLFSNYEEYKESSLNNRRIKHHDISPLIEKLKENEMFTVKKVGESIEGRSLNLISVGNGKQNVLLWSQMHGDEPTATQALFDIFNFLKSDDFQNEKNSILENCTLHFLPMLNPDGAERFTRRNVLGIDINRDALRLQSPEGITLKKVRDSLNADFGFNLHDQSTYYNTEGTENPATLSFLAPAYNLEKDINKKRGNAMKIIVYMNNMLQKYIPGQVGRYDDTFEPRAFGDNIQKWGTSTILIESGGFAADVEKQEIRKYNFIAILSSLYAIANNTFQNLPIDDYEKIPENDRKLFDLKLTALNYNLLGENYVVDVGFNHSEEEYKNTFYNQARIIDMGDLSTHYGYKTLDASNFQIVEAKVYPKIVKDVEELKEMDLHDIITQGYLFIIMEKLPEYPLMVQYPINLISSEKDMPKFRLAVGLNPNFLLKDSKVRFAVINGYLIDLEQEDGILKNGLIYKK